MSNEYNNQHSGFERGYRIPLEATAYADLAQFFQEGWYLKLGHNDAGHKFVDVWMPRNQVETTREAAKHGDIN